MSGMKLYFVEREDGESLAQHLNRNAHVLGASRDQRALLRRAAALSMGDRDDRIEAGIIAASVREQLKAALDEVIFTAQARGEAVTDWKEAKRVTGRDGLWLLADSRGISDAQFNTGLEYRALYEQVHTGALGSQADGLGSITAARTSVAGQLGQGLHRAYAGVRLTAAETAVRCLDKVALVRAVAGEGRTIRSLASGSRRRKTMVEELGAALDAVRLSFGQTGGLRIRGH